MNKKINEAQLKKDFKPTYNVDLNRFIKILGKNINDNTPIESVIKSVPEDDIKINDFLFKIIDDDQDAGDGEYEFTNIAPIINDDFYENIQTRLYIYALTTSIEAYFILDYYHGGLDETRNPDSEHTLRKKFDFIGVRGFFEALYQAYLWWIETYYKIKKSILTMENSDSFEALQEAKLKDKIGGEKRKNFDSKLPTEILVNGYNLEISQLVNGADIMVTVIDRLKNNLEKFSENIPEKEFRPIKYDVNFLTHFLKQLDKNADLIHAVFNYVKQEATRQFQATNYDNHMKLPVNQHYTYDRYIKKDDVQRFNEARLRGTPKPVKPKQEDEFPYDGNYPLEIHEKVTIWRVIDVEVNNPENVEDAINKYFNGDYNIIYDEFFYDTMDTLNPELNNNEATIEIKNNSGEVIWSNANQQPVNEARLRGTPKPVKPNEYTLNLEVKKTHWVRGTLYRHKAKNIREAVNYLIENVDNLDLDWEIIYESEELMDVEQNDGFPTKEILDNETGATIWDNVNGFNEEALADYPEDLFEAKLNKVFKKFQKGDRIKIKDNLLYDFYEKERPWVFEHYINNDSAVITYSQGSMNNSVLIDLKYIEKI